MREGEHAITLERSIGRAAVGAAAPGKLQRGPLLLAEVVLDARHPPLPPARCFLPSAHAHRQQATEPLATTSPTGTSPSLLRLQSHDVADEADVLALGLPAS